MESVRTEKGPRQKILVNLGRIDTKSGKEKIEILAQSIIKIAETIDLLDLEKDIKGEWAKELGPGLVFRKLFEKTGLDKVLSKTLGDNIDTEFDAKDCLFNLILNRLTEPGSKRNMTSWQEDRYGINKYGLQHYYRTMDHLNDNRDKIEEEIFKNMKRLSSARGKNINLALFDTTTIVYYGNGDKEESILDYGFSKDRRNDLKQVVVGLALTSDGIPLSHAVYSGNTNDVSCFKMTIDKFSQKHEISKVTFVGDRGMTSYRNLKYLEDFGYNYVLGFRMRTIRKIERSEVLKKVNLREIKDTLKYKNVEYHGRRLVVYYNPERAQIEADKRTEIVNRIKDRIKSGKIESIIENKDYKRFLKIEGKSPILDQKKIDADLVFDGIFILTTNTSMSASEVVKTYRNLWKCEFSFRTLKSELEMGPIYHWKERRIKSHIFICFLALILRIMLTREIKKVSKNTSYHEVINDLRNLYAMKIKIKFSEVITRAEIGDKAKLAFKALNMAFPKRILSYQNNRCMALEKN